MERVGNFLKRRNSPNGVDGVPGRYLSERSPNILKFRASLVSLLCKPSKIKKGDLRQQLRRRHAQYLIVFFLAFRKTVKKRGAGGRKHLSPLTALHSLQIAPQRRRVFIGRGRGVETIRRFYGRTVHIQLVGSRL